MSKFVIQGFHQLIQPGSHLGATGSKVSVHSLQSRWDSNCVLHLLAMVLQIAGTVAIEVAGAVTPP